MQNFSSRSKIELHHEAKPLLKSQLMFCMISQMIFILCWNIKSQSFPKSTNLPFSLMSKLTPNFSGFVKKASKSLKDFAILKKSREITNSNSKYLWQDCELYGDGMLKLTYYYCTIRFIMIKRFRRVHRSKGFIFHKAVKQGSGQKMPSSHTNQRCVWLSQLLAIE